jgi:hypothetical protein
MPLRAKQRRTELNRTEQNRTVELQIVHSFVDNGGSGGLSMSAVSSMLHRSLLLLLVHGGLGVVSLLLHHGGLLLAVGHGLSLLLHLVGLVLVSGMEEGSLLLKSGKLVILLSVLSGLQRLPEALQMNGAHSLALVGDLPPVLEASGNAEGRQLDGGLSDDLVGGYYVVVLDFEFHIISNVLHVEFELLVPGGLLAAVGVRLGALSFKTVLDGDVGVHRAESFDITGELRLNDRKLKGSCGGHLQSNNKKLIAG